MEGRRGQLLDSFSGEGVGLSREKSSLETSTEYMTHTDTHAPARCVLVFSTRPALARSSFVHTTEQACERDVSMCACVLKIMDGTESLKVKPDTRE